AAASSFDDRRARRSRLPRALARREQRFEHDRDLGLRRRHRGAVPALRVRHTRRGLGQRVRDDPHPAHGLHARRRADRSRAPRLDRFPVRSVLRRGAGPPWIRRRRAGARLAMKTTTRIWLGLSVVLAAVLAATRSEAVGERRIALSARPSVSGVHAVVYAQPFVLSKPWTHVWRVEQPSFDAGWLVVLDVDPTFVQPRQTFEPVLYAGDETVERINHGYEAGRVVA